MVDRASKLRERMVSWQIAARGILDHRLLDAFRKVPRERFVPEGTPLSAAYGDYPLPIGHGQTISQPFIVAQMVDLLEIDSGDRILEIGTGSGYQTAVLLEMGAEVVTVEVYVELVSKARRAVREVCPGKEAMFLVADGFSGWEPGSPYKGIVVSAAPPEVPGALLSQLADGGNLVIPVGRGIQELVTIRRRGEQYDRRFVESVRFVPLVKKDRS
ncbi:protein-L-isoaspartate(D-aspartate) O-methyltransferase [Candidatus Fermentibacteria bacterium]|nr:protein-L-isoaspartate(D-aspartate) O-methyltransferase [Candidatus Fermentibacteria bacterium]